MKQQRGIVLLMALIILIAMSLAGVALVRSVDTGNIISGNLAFKQSALSSTDRGVQTAFVWLNTNRAVLSNTNLSQGYYSSIAGSFTGFGNNDWNNAKTITSADSAGNSVEYVIHRLCSQADTAYNGTSPSGQMNQCSTSDSSTPVTNASAGGSMQVGASVFQSNPMVYYRVTTRVKGPRNTTSISQATIMVPI